VLGLALKEKNQLPTSWQNRIEEASKNDVQRRQKEKERPVAAWEGGREEMRSEGM
jgi:hypothetical protein